jgi:multidrug efflux pump subunit AcrB
MGTGRGSETRQPLGYAIVGGHTLSELLTLTTTPVVYIYLNLAKPCSGISMMVRPASP